MPRPSVHARRLPVVLAAVLLHALLAAAAQESMILATTTSTADTGLLDELVPRFEEQSGITVKVIAVGTGAALRMASTGDADAVLVHSPAAEQKYVASGDLVEGRRVMHNDFVVVGPRDDPARVRQAQTAADAMRAIARAGGFISRGDESGTHAQELALWQQAGVDPRSLPRREETGQGMGATLGIADQKRAYTLTDRGTYLALQTRLELAIVFEGDQSLRNVYHAYIVNPARHTAVKAAAARAFVRFLVAPAVQQAIGEFKWKEYGQPLFFPAAAGSPVK
jgi:tungstate transport system substrate-binding protein